MSAMARYLAACDIEIATQDYPKIIVSFNEAGISFEPANESEITFIDYCLQNGYNSDTVFKKPTSIKLEDGRISNVVRWMKNDSYGDYAVVARDGKYYRSIDPIITNSKEPQYDVGEIVDGNYFKGGKILRYSGAGFYDIGFTDGSVINAHISSMKNYKSGVSQPPATARRNQNMEFADEVAQWIRECGLARINGGRVTAGESKSGKKYKSIEFSYPRAIAGEIQIYGPKFILVKYNFRGKQGSFTAESPEEFHDLMTENFGSFIRDY